MENEMGMTTVWALEQNKFDEADHTWCRGLGVDVTVEPLFSTVYSYGRITSQVVKGWRIRIETTSEKQDSMLQLKYGDRLRIIEQKHILDEVLEQK